MSEKTMEKLELEALTYQKQALDYKVRDDGTLVAANSFLLNIKKMRKEIVETFRPIIAKAHEAHQLALQQQRRFESPLIEAEQIVKKEIASYMAELERIRREAEEKARKEREMAERKAREEEEIRLNEAREAVLSGDIKAAEELLDKEPEPIEMKIVVPEKKKLEGISIRKIWKWKIVNEKKIPRKYLMPNETLINAVVRMKKGDTEIAGIKVYPEDIVSSRSA